MGQHMLTRPDVEFTDPRRNQDSSKVDSVSHNVGETIFTANATGTGTTLVGATENNGTNAVRVGTTGSIFKADGTFMGIVTVSSVATSTSDTITFAPSVGTNTLTGWTLKSNNPRAYNDNASLDARLLAIGGCYTQAYIDSMTQNDKVYAIRVNDDPHSING